MKRIILILIFVFVLVSCSDNPIGFQCGKGTIELNGECVVEEVEDITGPVLSVNDERFIEGIFVLNENEDIPDWESIIHAEDDFDGYLAINIISDNVDTSVPGLYKVIFNSTDLSDNMTSAFFNVKVQRRVEITLDDENYFDFISIRTGYYNSTRNVNCSYSRTTEFDYFDVEITVTVFYKGGYTPYTNWQTRSVLLPEYGTSEGVYTIYTDFGIADAYSILTSISGTVVYYE